MVNTYIPHNVTQCRLVSQNFNDVGASDLNAELRGGQSRGGEGEGKAFASFFRCQWGTFSHWDGETCQYQYHLCKTTARIPLPFLGTPSEAGLFPVLVRAPVR